MASATVTDPMKKYGAEAGVPVEETRQRIRITLHSSDLKAIEKVGKSFLESARNKNLDVRGPVRMPKTLLHIHTRKSPCGQGSKTWDKFEMRLYKRIVDIYAQPDIIRQISTFATVDANVHIEVCVREM